MAAHCGTVKAFVLMTDRVHMPHTTGVKQLLCYEELISASADDYVWPQFDESAAASLCQAGAEKLL